MENKKGSSVVGFFIFIFASLIIAIFLGLAVFGFNIFTEVLGQDVDIGQTNLKDVTETTFGQMNTGIINNADTIGIIILFSMILTMVLNGYFTGSQNPKVFFIVDVFLLAFFFIPSVYVSRIYNEFISASTILQDTFINVIPKTSKFMLNLPIIIAVAGILTIIITYSSLGKRQNKGDSVNVQGF